MRLRTSFAPMLKPCWLPDATPGSIAPLCQRFTPTTVARETTTTIAANKAASCEKESSQLRLVQLFQNLLRGAATELTSAVAPASIILRIRSQRAFSFGGASYCPRWVRQNPTIEVKSSRTPAHSRHSSKCDVSVDWSFGVIDPSRNSLIKS